MNIKIISKWNMLTITAVLLFIAFIKPLWETPLMLGLINSPEPTITVVRIENLSETERIRIL